MNIFYLHESPEEAVKPMYNKHIVKMILETAQMLCTAHHELGNGDNVPYKSTHVHHPSTVWARTNSANYDWLYCHFIALCDEYTKRYGKVHLSYTKCAEALYDAPPKIERSRVCSTMPQCMEPEYKVDGDPIRGYRNYYLRAKKHIANKNEKVLTNIFGYSI